MGIFFITNLLIPMHFLYAKKVSKENTLGCYYAIQYFKDGIKYTNANSENYAHIIGSRFATRDEVKKFLTDLEKEYHKRWNEETKQLEDIRWRANQLGYYFYVNTSTFNVRGTYDARDVASELRYKNSNYFSTPEAAQKVADQIKEIFKNSKAE